MFSSIESVAAEQTDQFAEYAYVPNEKTDDVSVINTTTNTVISTLHVGNNPVGVAVNHDGTRVYVTNSGDDIDRGYTFSIIYTDTDEVISKLVYAGEGVKPFGVAITPDETLYIASYVTGKVYAINLTADYSTPINVGIHPVGVAITPDGKTVYVANRGSDSISVINTTTNNVTATVNVGIEPYGVAVSSDGRVYVTNQNSNSVSVINATTNNIITTVDVGVNPHGVAVTPNGKWVYVANHNSYYGTVSVINTTTYITENIRINGTPCGVAVTPDGRWVYVTTFSNVSDPGSVYVINTTTNKVMNDPISVGILPSGLGQFICLVPESRVETTTALSLSLNRSPVGEQEILTATVSTAPQGIEKPSGSVTFVIDRTSSTDKNLISGNATLDLSMLSNGTHSIIARYKGNSKFRPSTSSSFILPVKVPDSKGSDKEPAIDLIVNVVGGIIVLIAGIVIKKRFSTK